MEMELWAAASLVGLGAWHGVNPGMGWLFAVALGLQRGEARAVWRALPPLAAGHAAAVAAALVAALAVGAVVPLGALRWGVAGALVTMGLHRLLRHRHPRYGGMRVGGRQLATWSFLMASAHGAGLMVVPLVLADPPGAAHHAHGALAAGVGSGGLGGLAATALHTAGYLAVTGLVAALVHGRLGVKWIRTGWLNLDLLWGAALVLTGLATPLL